MYWPQQNNECNQSNTFCNEYNLFLQQAVNKIKKTFAVQQYMEQGCSVRNLSRKSDTAQV